jgi:hypothetical protein
MDGKIQDNAIERQLEPMPNTEIFQNHARMVGDHSIEPLNVLKLLSRDL